MKSDLQLKRLRDGEPLSTKEKMELVARLSMPAMLSQLSAVAMEYIDAGMVGHLGANATASIGLVMTSLWLVGSIGWASVAGFSAPLSHAIGAKDNKKARGLLYQSIFIVAAISVFFAVSGILLHRKIPIWLGGRGEIAEGASGYFFVYCLFMPTAILSYLFSTMLQCSGNMKVPGILNSMACLLDVIFNFFCIYPTRRIAVLGHELPMPGLGLGVRGAALGTGLSDLAVCLLLFAFLMKRDSPLRFRRGEGYRLRSEDIKKFLRISLPVAFQHTVVSGAQVVSTRIVSPLGTVAIAANSLAVIAESLCYEPGFGVEEAASTLVGQSLGARRRDMAVSFGKISLLFGMGVMGGLGVLLYASAPWVMGALSTDGAVVSLAAKSLRTEVVVEALYAASIVGAGVFRGAEDTFVPSMISFISLWGVRIPLAIFLSGRMGLVGFWLAMAIELSIRGMLFLLRFASGRWLKRFE